MFDSSWPPWVSVELMPNNAAVCFRMRYIMGPRPWEHYTRAHGKFLQAVEIMLTGSWLDFRYWTVIFKTTATAVFDSMTHYSNIAAEIAALEDHESDIQAAIMDQEEIEARHVDLDGEDHAYIYAPDWYWDSD